jgi:hypothetical protein
MINIDRDYLLELCAALMDGHINYHMGAKAHPLDAEPADIKALDCSGFTRYLIHKVTDGQVTMVDGSDEQNAWCKHHKLRAEKYMHVAGLSDGLLRTAFMPRIYKDGKLAHAGHVWLVLNGKTLESHGHTGPDSRDWNTPVLTARVKTCYVLAHLYSITVGPITVGTA